MFSNLLRGKNGRRAERAPKDGMEIRTTQVASGSSSGIVRAKTVEIDGKADVHTVVLLPNGERVMSRDGNGVIRHWRVDNGREVEAAMSEEGGVLSMAVSQDGKWIVTGMGRGDVQVWNAENDEKVKKWKGHSDSVRAVDISPDGSKIATGSTDKTACVWSRKTGKQLFGPWEHERPVSVKFSPDGRLVATATWWHGSVRAYDVRNGRLLFDAAIRTNSIENNSLAWRGDARQLFALGLDGCICAVDASTGTILSKWAIHDSRDAKCIALAHNSAFIAASANSKVSFWDTSTPQQIGTVLEYTHPIRSLALSDNFHLAICGSTKITLYRLCDALTPSYLVDARLPDQFQESSSSSIVQLTDTILEPTESRQAASEQSETIKSLRAALSAQEKKSRNLEKAAQDLRNQLAASRLVADQKKDALSKTIDSLRAREESSNSKIIHLEQTTQQLYEELATSRRTAGEAIIALRSNIRAGDASSDARLGNLEQITQDLRNQLASSEITHSKTVDSLRSREEISSNEIACLQQGNKQLERKADTLIRIIRAHEQKHACETLYAQGRIHDTVDFLFQLTSFADEDVKADRLLFSWFTGFRQRCMETLEKMGDSASAAENWEEATSAYGAALLLNPLTDDIVPKKWARSVLSDCSKSVHEVLNTAAKFGVSRFLVYRAVCKLLEEDGRLTEAVECFQWMKNDGLNDVIDDEQVEWEQSFRERCAEKFVEMGDDASNTKKHSEAAAYYSHALSLKPVDFNEILLKHSNEFIKLEPSSHEGYQKRHAALMGMSRHKEAFDAFNMMLSKIDQSPDPKVLELRDQFLDATPLIREAVLQTISPMPRVLIDTATGRLCGKTQQAAAFEELPVFDELRSSMTTPDRLDRGRILDEVKKFYSYVMFSHRWENGEPSYQLVVDISVDELVSTPPNTKLKMFHQVMRALGFKWIWTDTCCIDKKDNVVLQESLVAMFTWYHGSSLTVVYLRGVWSHSQIPGDLRRSVWNKRVWTYQEYLAAKRVLFYTEDWKLYLDLDVSNHKESPAIIAEMELASRVSEQQMAALRPGLDRVREKLFLASARETTYVEDIAYSLLGIFNASIPVIYGEGDRAVGRLLEHVLTGSGDVSVLAWTGCSGGYNTCLPINLKVYSQVVPPHVPLLIEGGEMDSMVATLRSSPTDLSVAVPLHDQLRKLPSPFMVSSRLRLGCIVFPVIDVICVESDPESGVHVYCAITAALGSVGIKTKDDLTSIEDLNLVHPWIKPLFDQNLPRRGIGLNDVTPALRLVARLRQPFGALLLAPLSDMQHRRVATDALIMARIQEGTALGELMDDIDTLDIQ